MKPALRREHPFTAAVRRALPAPRTKVAQEFLALLERRLRSLQELAQGRTGSPALPRGRAVAHRFLGRFEGTWDDGDENFVRGYLDRWVRSGEDPLRAAARSLLDAAEALGRITTRPSTLWFFLWEMESLLSELGPAPKNRRIGC